jgi:hypothetical protein
MAAMLDAQGQGSGPLPAVSSLAGFVPKLSLGVVEQIRQLNQIQDTLCRLNILDRRESHID